mmetsp:Transcript_9896/g.36891  ORF Transcript_9896/g.36891 Transcript_9896/m.36891 type:complete len:458 (+) Transcript_9896:144-1517(+)
MTNNPGTLPASHPIAPFHYATTLLPVPTLHAIHTSPPLIHPMILHCYLQGYTPSQILAILQRSYDIGNNHQHRRNQQQQKEAVVVSATGTSATDPQRPRRISTAQTPQQPLQQSHALSSQMPPHLASILLPDIVSQCRLLKRLESHLLSSSPRLFLTDSAEGRALGWNQQIKMFYVRRFFLCHQGVLRELLGKKLTGKERRDLDDIANKLHVPLVACRRMFDNLRVILERVREVTREREMCPSLIDVIREEFGLDEQVAKQYATGVFSCHHRFALGSRVAWLKDVSYEDLEFCMDTIRENWTRRLPTSSDPLQIDLDRNALREIKHYFFANQSRMDRFRKLVLASFKVDSKHSKLLHAHFKTALKNLILIAGKLIQKKELRDFFIDICEKFGDICVEQCQLSPDNIYQLCERIIACFPTATEKKISGDQNMINNWTYFVIVVRNCLHRIMEFGSFWE